MSTEPDRKPNYPAGAAKRSLLPLIFWSMPIVMLIIGTTLFADNQRNLRHIVKLSFGLQPPQQEPLSRPQISDTLLPEMTSTTAPILSRPQIGTRPLIRLVGAMERCMKLKKPNQEPPAYLESTAFSQCTVLWTYGVEEPSPSVFVQLQTDPAGMVSSFRLKFNTAGNTPQMIADEGLAALQSFGGFYLGIEELMPVLGKKINRWEDFQTVLGPYSIEMDREILDPTRFNVFGRINRTQTSATSQWRREQGRALRQ